MRFEKKRCDKWLLWQRENGINIKALIKMKANKKTNTIPNNTQNSIHSVPLGQLSNTWNDDLEDNTKRDR